ncbi:MAG: SAM-dependent methyltransferase [Blastocatellia bacterium AA13]|nr:MAG: SAM-dependent methyltransferase [Blastocatellia bacterium AA13]
MTTAVGREADYGDSIAEIYDDSYPAPPPEMISALHELAGAGPALELGIGTGRIALLLAARGLEVHGIDASQAMITRLRSKPGSERIKTSIGNFARVDVEQSYPLIFVAFNTLFWLTTQDEQVECFKNVARKLSPGGLFLIEAFVPDLKRYRNSQLLEVKQVLPGGVRLEATSHDAINQRAHTQNVVLAEGGVKLYPVEVRYAWPAELDLMARLAGMRLKERWANWHRDPIGPNSSNHISIYELSS